MINATNAFYLAASNIAISTTILLFYSLSLNLRYESFSLLAFNITMTIANFYYFIHYFFSIFTIDTSFFLLVIVQYHHFLILFIILQLRDQYYRFSYLLSFNITMTITVFYYDKQIRLLLLDKNITAMYISQQ